MEREKTHREVFAIQIKEAQAPFNEGLTQAEWSQVQLDLQNEQVPTMIWAERAFVDAIARVPRLRELILTSFLRHIQAAGRAASEARAYYRERNLLFNREVMPAIVRGDWAALDSFAVNWEFVMFAWQYLEVEDPELLRRQRKAAGTSVLEPAPERLMCGIGRRKVKPAIGEAMVEATEVLSKIRHDLVVTNMQLIVDRARAFFRCTPESPQTSDMDLISIAAEGAIAGIDKVMIECRPAPHWEPTWHPANYKDGVFQGFETAYWRGHSAAGPKEEFAFPEFIVSGYRVDGHHTAAKHVPKTQRPECPASVFRTTAIGRMGGRLIQTYSQTHMHLGPGDKRLLYQANRVAAQHSESGTPDYQGMASHILRDRVAWAIAKKSKQDVREIAPVIEKLFLLANENWEMVVEALCELHRFFPEWLPAPIAEDEGALAAWKTIAKQFPSMVEKAQKKAPSDRDVSSVMLSNSVVPVIDDEGNDRLNEASSYAAPESEEPDRRLEAQEARAEMLRALSLLSLLDRKLLVLLGLAPIDCIDELLPIEA